MVHELKTHSLYFQRIVDGVKNFEVRKNDRDFQVGDQVVLKNFDPETKEYLTGEVHGTITYILQGGQFGIQSGYCVFGYTRP